MERRHCRRTDRSVPLLEDHRHRVGTPRAGRGREYLVRIRHHRPRPAFVSAGRSAGGTTAGEAGYVLGRENRTPRVVPLSRHLLGGGRRSCEHDFARGRGEWAAGCLPKASRCAHSARSYGWATGLSGRPRLLVFGCCVIRHRRQPGRGRREDDLVAMAHNELETLLSRDLSATRVWEQGEFDRLSEGRPLVLMGAGGLGRLALAGLRRRGVEPLAFADNATFGTRVSGVEVLSPASAAEQFGDRAAFVVTIWGANRPHRFAHSRQQLLELGCHVVCPFPPLFWKYADVFLPFYLQDLPSKVLEQRASVRKGFDLWGDEASRAEYVAQVRLRLLADFDGLGHPVAHPQYFPDDLFDWSEDEWIVDGGAYDGDTVRMVSTLHPDGFGHL